MNPRIKTPTRCVVPAAWVLATCAALAAGGLARAAPERAEGVAGYPPMPEVLKNIKPATGACRREDFADPAAKLSSARRTSRLRSDCAISFTELEKLRSDTSTVLVDVRAPSPGTQPLWGEAMQIPLSAVRTKTFLREKTVVLMGSGKAEQDLYEACADLGVAGFRRVKVLQGGALVSPVTTARADEASAGRLTASELWAESLFEANLVLVANRQTELRKHLRASEALPDLEPAAVRAVVERWRKERKGPFLASLVLVLEPEVSLKAVQQLQEAMRPLPVLFYADTSANYMKYQTQQKVVWDARERGPRQPGCGS